MKTCNHAPSKYVGIVTNQPDGYDSARPHASTSTCARERCINDSLRWVAAETNEVAHFRTYEQMRATRQQAQP